MYYVDEPLICWHTGGDWFAILCKRRLAQINGASVEGTGAEMLALADALRDRLPFTGENSRCRLGYDGEAFTLSSPRNSMTDTRIPMRHAAGLVKSIRAEVAEYRARPPEPALDVDEEPLFVDVPTTSDRVRGRVRTVAT